jgi:tetratricopeptide (TPR) repeat protein
MMFRFVLRIALVGVGCFLILGCRRPHPLTADRSPKPTALQRAPRHLAAEDGAARNRIEAQAHYAAGVLHALDEETEPALSEFYAAVLKDPTNISLAMEVSQDFIEAGQLEKAVTVLEVETNQPGASEELFSHLGALYFRLNRTGAAVGACRNAIKKNPRAADAYPILFQIYFQNGQFADALNLVDGAAKVSLAPGELLVLCGELYLQLSTRMPDQKQVLSARALEIFQRANINEIKAPEVLLRLAEGFNSLNHDKETAAIYEKLLNDFPELSLVRERVRAKLADILLRMKDHPRAAEVLKSMVRDNPTDFRANYLLGNLSYEMTNMVQAAESYSRTILLNPDFQPAYAELASTQLSLDKTADAKATLEAARKKFPRDFSIEYLSGMVAIRENNFTNAVQCFTEAEVIAQAGNPNQLREMFYFEFGSAYERLGDLAQAEKNFLKCLAIAPDFDEAQNYLGFMWAEHGLNLTRARELIEKALKTDPKNAAYLDSMAWVLFKLNEPQRALDYELKAIAHSEEEDAEVYDHLGDIYAGLGQTAKAREAWQKSVKLEPNEGIQKKLGTAPQ